tara:strand:+ start:2184 stop:3488 length:1305 start_codon:yes stop_codon:yes gene_type:complete
MLSRNDIFAFKFNRKNKTHLSALTDGSIKFTRQDKNNSVRIITQCPDDSFSLEKFSGDYDDATSRTKNYFITNRKDGESIILSLETDIDTVLESDFIFISYLGDDRFIVFAEHPFEFVNKTYTPPSYDATSLELPEKIIAQADKISQKLSNQQFGSVSVNDCRGITYELDSIINGTATNQLREKAVKLKRKLESSIIEIGKKQGKNKLSLRFKEIRTNTLIEQLKEFVIANHGKAAFDDIERSSLRAANDKIKRDYEFADDVFSYEKGTEHQILSLQNKLQELTVSSMANDFLGNVMPPKVPISKCSQCGGRARLAVMPQISKGKKKHEVKCQNCDNRTEGGRIGAEAVYAWNLANDKNLTYRDVKEFGLSLLAPDEARERVEALRRYQSLKQQEIALRLKIASQKEMQELKKVKGKNTVLLLLLNYLSEILKK